MPYSITLILEKKPENSEALSEIKKYIEEKEGKILNISELGDAKLKPGKKTVESTITKIDIEIKPDRIEKIKNKIDHEKEIVSYILEKKKIISAKKKNFEENKDKNLKKRITAPSSVKTKDKTEKKPKSKKEDANKAKRVLASMQEEEKKIKDLNSTLDKILNE